jgi:hypothetical protein
MGCFSYMCKECDKPVLSTSFAGQDVWLFLLKDGKVVQQMDGEYDSYGRCFIDGTQDPRVTHGLRLSHQWTPVNNDPDDRENWHYVCDLHFNDNPADGMAAVHKKCWTGNVPTTQSEDDPDQGWGEDYELLADTSSEKIE